MQLTRETRGEMKIACKRCHFVTCYSVSYIEDAINDGLELTCSVCEEKFKVVVMPLDTITAQQGLHTDAGESADLQAVSSASAESTSQALSTPTQRR